jgi:DNA-directed RNA polymerase specialized sigma24 family protein
VVEEYRRELEVHCYRMLGSLHEAEDLVRDPAVVELFDRTRARPGGGRPDGRTSRQRRPARAPWGPSQ